MRKFELTEGELPMVRAALCAHRDKLEVAIRKARRAKDGDHANILTIEGPRIWAMLKVSYYCFKAAFWLRRYARQLERAEAAKREHFALEAERLGFPALANEIRNPKNWKGERN